LYVDVIASHMHWFQLVTTPGNIFDSFSDSAKIAKNSVILTVDLYDEDGNRLPIKDTREPFEIVMKRPDTVQPAAERQYSVMSLQDSRVDLFYYQVNVTSSDSSLHLAIDELDPDVQLLVLARFNDFPQLNTTDYGTRGWDFMQLLPISRTNIGQSPRRHDLLSNLKAHFYYAFKFAIINVLITI